MMNYGKATLVLMLVLLVGLGTTQAASAYKQGKMAYEQGDYDRSAYLLMQYLRKKPKHKKSIGLLETVLPIAYKTHQTAAETAKTRQDHDGLVAAYQAISRLSNEVDTLPPIRLKKKKPPIEWPTVDIAGLLAEASEGAAEFHYAKGQDFLARGGGPVAAQEFAAALEYQPNYKDSKTLAAESHYVRGVAYNEVKEYKAAAIEFRSTRTFVNAYKDSEDLYTECRTAAMKRVAVMPFENMSGRRQYGAVGELLSGQVLSKALSLNPEFIEFVDRNQLSVLLAEKGQQDFGIIDPGTALTAGKLAGVHAFVFGKVLIISENFPGEQVSPAQRQTVEVYNREADRNEILSATYRLHTLEGAIDVTASLSIVDGQTGAMLNADQISAGRKDVARWLTFQGDERAVPSFALSSQTPGGQRPLETPQNMVMDAIDELSSNLANKLVDTFD